MSTGGPRGRQLSRGWRESQVRRGCEKCGPKWPQSCRAGQTGWKRAGVGPLDAGIQHLHFRSEETEAAVTKPAGDRHRVQLLRGRHAWTVSAEFREPRGQRLRAHWPRTPSEAKAGQKGRGRKRAVRTTQMVAGFSLQWYLRELYLNLDSGRDFSTLHRPGE